MSPYWHGTRAHLPLSHYCSDSERHRVFVLETFKFAKHRGLQSGISIRDPEEIQRAQVIIMKGLGLWVEEVAWEVLG
jgi:hypothetical protein